MGRQAGSVYVDQLASGFGYVSQESWIQHATFKDNILFGRSYDVDRYEDVLKACALYEDLKVCTVFPGIDCCIGYERVYLPLYKVTDTPFHIQGEGVLFM